MQLAKGDSKLVAMLALWLGPIGILLAVGISYIFATNILFIRLIFKQSKVWTSCYTI